VDYVIVVLLALVSRRVLALQSLSNGTPSLMSPLVDIER